MNKCQELSKLIILNRQIIPGTLTLTRQPFLSPGSVFSPETAGIAAKKAMMSTDKIFMPLNSNTAFHERENPIR